MRDIVGEKLAQRDAGPTEPQPAAPAQFPHLIAVRLDPELLAAIRNALEAAWTVGDYHLASMADVVRAALRAHIRGDLPLAPLPRKSQRQRTSLGIDEPLKRWYDGLPDRKRGEIIERIVRAFIDRHLTTL